MENKQATNFSADDIRYVPCSLIAGMLKLGNFRILVANGCRSSIAGQMSEH